MSACYVSIDMEIDQKLNGQDYRGAVETFINRVSRERCDPQTVGRLIRKCEMYKESDAIENLLNICIQHEINLSSYDFSLAFKCLILDRRMSSCQKLLLKYLDWKNEIEENLLVNFIEICFQLSCHESLDEILMKTLQYQTPGVNFWLALMKGYNAIDQLATLVPLFKDAPFEETSGSYIWDRFLEICRTSEKITPAFSAIKLIYDEHHGENSKAATLTKMINSYVASILSQAPSLTTFREFIAPFCSLCEITSVNQRDILEVLVACRAAHSELKHVLESFGLQVHESGVNFLMSEAIETSNHHLVQVIMDKLDHPEFPLTIHSLDLSSEQLRTLVLLVYQSSKLENPEIETRTVGSSPFRKASKGAQPTELKLEEESQHKIETEPKNEPKYFVRHEHGDGEEGGEGEGFVMI